MRSILARKRRRDLRRQRAGVVAVAVTVALGTMLFAAAWDAYRNLQASYDRTYDQTGFAHVWVGGGDLGAVQAGLEGMAEVMAIERRHVVDVPLRFNGDHVLLGRLVGLPSGDVEVNDVVVLAGERRDALLEQRGAEHFDVGPGGTVEAFDGSAWRALPIGGVIASPEYLWLARDLNEPFSGPEDFAVVVVPDDLLAATLPPGEGEELVVRLDSDAPAAADRVVEEAIGLGAGSAHTRERQASYVSLNEDVAGLGELAWMFPALFLSAAALAAFVLIGRLVRTQRALIGGLVAEGISPRQVFRHFVGFGIWASMAGAVPGVLLGTWMGRALTHVYTDFLDVPVTVTRWSVETIVIGLAFGLLCGLAAGGLPARAAARLQPATAMRPEAPAAVGRPSAAERLLPARAGLGARLVLRNVTRNRRRAMTTLVGVLLGYVLVLISGAMLDTMDHLIVRQFDEVSTEDAFVVVAPDQAGATLAALAALPVAARVEPTTSVSAVIGAADASEPVPVEVRGMVAGTTMHAFPDGLPGTGLVVDDKLADRLGVEVGDQVDLDVGGVVTTVAVAGTVHEPLGTLAYAERDWLGGVVGPPTGSGAVVAAALVQYADGADRAQARAAIGDADGVLAVVDRRALLSTLDQIMGFLRLFIGVMYVFGGLMAAALLFNAVTVSMAERRTEVATMIADGMPMRRVRRLLGAETLLLTGVGTIPGIALGLLAARGFMAELATETFSFDLWVDASSVVLAVVTVVGSAIVAQAVATRSLVAMDLAGTLRERGG